MKTNKKARKYFPIMEQAGFNRDERRLYFRNYENNRLSPYILASSISSMALSGLAGTVAENQDGVLAQNIANPITMTSTMVLAVGFMVSAYALINNGAKDIKFNKDLTQVINARKEVAAGKIPTLGYEGTNFA